MINPFLVCCFGDDFESFRRYLILLSFCSLSIFSVKDSPNKYAEESSADSANFTNCNGRVGLITSHWYWFKTWLTFPSNGKEFYSNDKGVLISRLTLLCFGKSLVSSEVVLNINVVDGYVFWMLCILKCMVEPRNDQKYLWI